MYRFEYDEDLMPKMVIQFSAEGVSHSLTVHIIRLPFVFESDIDLTKTRLISIINAVFM